ncbi:MAG: hypothetical protein GX793_05775 [Bacteroidales bacterium]|jgi:hypothetical protein|nr:hypothetical protein [Bacteroidales bacterium]MCK9497991.1 hypothetical protein [Bacteroidales bacterium]NLB86551.1 hypothetical protein [Bacteroidales bacterium]
MKKYFLILIFAFASQLVVAQEDKFYFGNENHFSNTNNTEQEKKIPFKTKTNTNKFRTSFSAGTGFSSFYGQNLFYNYVSPKIDYNFTDKFTLTAGTAFVSSNFPSYLDWNAENRTSKTMNQNKLYFFMKGSYLINDKLRVHASSIFDTNPTAFSNNSSNSFNSFGFDYKIGENSYISAEISIHKQNSYNPLFRPYNPIYYDNPLIRPFGNSMFSDPFPEW